MRPVSHAIEGFLKTIPHVPPVPTVVREIPANKWLLWAELHRASEEGDTARMAVINAQLDALDDGTCNHCGCDLSTADGAEDGLCGPCIKEIEG